MAMILCPTRGGEASYPNQDRAIAIAKERGAAILFLYNSNPQFLNQTASPVVVDVETELEEMGEFLMLMAKERADKAGVAAETMVASGIFSEVLRDVIEEHEVEAVVLGSAREETGLTTQAYLEELSANLAEELGVEVMLARRGKVVSTFAPAEKK